MHVGARGCGTGRWWGVDDSALSISYNGLSVVIESAFVWEVGVIFFEEPDSTAGYVSLRAGFPCPVGGIADMIATAPKTSPEVAGKTTLILVVGVWVNGVGRCT